MSALCSSICHGERETVLIGYNARGGLFPMDHTIIFSWRICIINGPFRILKYHKYFSEMFHTSPKPSAKMRKETRFQSLNMPASLSHSMISRHYSKRNLYLVIHFLTFSGAKAKAKAKPKAKPKSSHKRLCIHLSYSI